MSDYQLGQHVTYTEHLIRKTRVGEGVHSETTKIWTSDRYSFPEGGKTEGGQGIIIGKRTLANGENHYNGYDEPITFKPKERFTAYLVAYDLRRKPVYVRPEHIQTLPVGATTTGLDQTPSTTPEARS